MSQGSIGGVGNDGGSGPKIDWARKITEQALVEDEQRDDDPRKQSVQALRDSFKKKPMKQLSYRAVDPSRGPDSSKET
jgi:hypothetical protein